MGQQVFISYSSKEVDVAQRTREILENNGISCWMAPDSIPAGSDYGKEIEDAICGCSALVLILSAKSQQSVWVTKEVSVAISNGKTILPFHIDASELVKPFSFHLTNIQRIEAYENLSNAYEELLGRIRGTEPAPAAVTVESGSAAAQDASSAADSTPKQSSFARKLTDFFTGGGKVKDKTAFIRLLSVDTEAFTRRLPTCEALKILHETVRYSDPVSVSEVHAIEERVREKNDRLTETVNAGDAESAQTIATEMRLLLEDRNALLKAVK